MSLTHPEKLREYLHQLDSGLTETADILWRLAKPIHDRSNRPDSHENGYGHALQVEANIWKLIREAKRVEDFSELDLFLLSCSTCCHDFDKGLESALQGDPAHGVGSQQFVEDGRLDILLTRPVQAAIGDIVSLHNLKVEDFGERIPSINDCPIGNRTVDLRRLAVLLKAGDILHCDATRVPRMGIDAVNLPEEKCKRSRYLARNCTSGWEVDGAKVVLLALPRNEEESTAVVAAHRFMCDEEWPAVEQRLDDMRFPHLLYLTIRRRGEPDIHHPPTLPSPPLLNLHQIGEPVGDFVGREGEIEMFLAAFDGAEKRGAVISGLRGMGGVGKTELAKVLSKRIKERFPDGQIAFNLRGARDDDSSKPATAAEALQHVIRSFHPEAKLPEDVDALRGLYHSVLEGKRVLLLMDNALNAGQLAGLVPLPDGSSLMVTSRLRFVLTSMTEIDLDTLSPDDARDLLLSICTRIGEHANALAERCGHLPLALRLAASALKTRPMLGVEDYLKDLSNEKNRLATLDEYKDSTDEARGIEASLAISYRLLDEGQQRHWRALAVSPADFDAAAAGSIWKSKEKVAKRALGDLYAASMVEWDKATKRFRLHDLARDYARARLSEKERVVNAQRHAAHYVKVLRKGNDLYLVGGDSMLQGLALCDREWGNIRAGQAWAAAFWETEEPAAKICNEYPNVGTHCLDLRLHSRERIVWLKAAVEAARRLKDRKAEGYHLGNLGNANYLLGETRKAISYYEQFLVISREIGDRRGEGNALGNLGNAYADLGETRKAIGFYEQILIIHREIGDRRGEGADLGNLGSAYYLLGEPRKAIEFYKQALVIDHEIGDRHDEGAVLGNLGLAYADLGETHKAIGFYEQDLVIAREIGDRRGEGNALGSLGGAYAALGETRKAIEYYEQYLAIAREIGDRRGEGNALGNLGLDYADLSESRKAIGFFEQQLAIVREIGDRRGEGTVLGNLGNAYAALGETRKAIEFYEQSLVIASQIGDRRGEGAVHFNLVDALVKTGRRDEAITHAEQAIKIYEQIESPHAAEARAQLEEVRRGK